MNSERDIIELPDGRATVEYQKGYTEDIMRSVRDCYRDTIPQSRVLAEYLTGATPEDSCRNVFEFVERNIRYVEDPDGVQWVRTPSRLLNDGEGDCKSYTILICTVLANLNIEHLLRFVTYVDGGEYTHVYPVAVIDGRELPMDVVAKQLRGIPMGKELTYKGHKDMKGSVISRLSGIGDTEQEQEQERSYLSDIDFSNFRRQNETLLVSEIELANARSRIDKARQVECYNQIDWLRLCLYCLTLSKREDYLEIGGLLLAKYRADGVFESEETDIEARRRYFDRVCADFRRDFDTLTSSGDMSTDFTEEFRMANAGLLTWWTELIKTGQDVAGIGATADYPSLIKAVAPSMLYSTQRERMGTAKAKRKQERQDKLVQYIASRSGLSAQAIENYTRTGIINTFGMEAERVIDVLKRGRRANIGSVGDLDTMAMNNQLLADQSALDAKNAAAQILQNSALNAGTGSVATRYAWVDAVTGIAHAISTTANSITGIMQQLTVLTGKDLNYANYQGYASLIPNTSDWTSSPIVLAGGVALLGVGGYMLLGRKNNKRKRSRK